MCGRPLLLRCWLTVLDGSAAHGWTYSLIQSAAVTDRVLASLHCWLVEAVGHLPAALAVQPMSRAETIAASEFPQ